VEILSYKTDSFPVSSNHFFYKCTNVRLIIRKETVCPQRAVETGCGGIHKKKRNAQAADHLAVLIVKHLKTYDTGGLFRVKGTGKLQAFDFLVQDAVHGKTVT
jgi:hypothetical protein